jgi:hypothetical protein
VYLFQVSLLLIGQQGFGTFLHFSGIGPCFPLAEGLCKFYAKTPEENDQYSPTTLSAIQAVSQSTFINEQL